MMKKVIGLMLAAFMVGAVLLGALSLNVGAEAQLPVWEVGDGWYFGETVDFSELQQEIDEGLSEIPPEFSADVDVAGGIGIYFGIEVVSDSAEVNGYTCYQVDLDGAIGIDFGLDAWVDGSMNEDFMSIDIDAEGSAVVEGEANLDGSLYFTVDDLAFVKGEFKITADATATASIDADVKMNMAFGQESQSIDAHIIGDASVEINNVELTGSLEFDPPIDFFDFPIYLGDMWNVPTSDTDVTGTWSGSGTIVASADVTGIAAIDPSAEDIHESETIDLADEIGSHTVDAILDEWNAITLKCVAVVDDTYYIIETDTDDIFAYADFGTRQFGGINPLDMLPIDDVMPETAGVQYSANDGFINGVSVDGEVMTETTDKASVDTFLNDPLGEVQEETGGAGSVGTGGGGLGALLLIGIILIVVIIVVVAVVASKGKKKGPEQMYGAPQQQPPYQEQPPPQQQPPEQQPPPQQPPPPPPPPPPGQ